MEAVSFIDQRWPIGALPVGQTQVGNMNPTMSRIDDRDRAVLDRLEVGQTVTPEAIKKLYRHHTDVRRSRTLRRRVEDLLHQPEFEDAGFKRWKYRGTG